MLPLPQATHLIAVAWALRLVMGKRVELDFVEGISPETVRWVLKNTS